MLQISFTDVENGVQEAKIVVARHVTQLADAEHRQRHGILAKHARGLDASVTAARGDNRTLEMI